MKNNTEYIMYSVLSFIGGVLFTGILLFFPKFEQTFYDVKITDIMLIFVTAFVGTIILKKVSIATTNIARTKDILLESVGAYQKNISIYHNKIIKNITVPEEFSSAQVLSNFKVISNNISLLSSILDQGDFVQQDIIGQIKQEYFTYKGMITDEGFAVADPKQSIAAYSERVLSEIEVGYQKIMTLFFKLKIDIYK